MEPPRDDDGGLLISISGEDDDDSLLQQSPSLVDTSPPSSFTGNFFFPCSPLHHITPAPHTGPHHHRLPVSPLGVGRQGNTVTPTSSSSTGYGNKENMNVNKLEMAKLRVEPQQMKKSKRGGAHNLQKSLAWDKAFSTEQGVLNPLELSMLDGSIGDSCRKKVLPRVREGRRLFDGNSLNQQVTPKTLLNQKGSRLVSKSGCPRPLTFSSLKRPANTSMLKAGPKESKLPKLPVPKSGSPSLHRFSKSNLPSSSQTKHNQIAQEDIQKVAGLQGTAKNIRLHPLKQKCDSDATSLAPKSSASQFRRNKGNSAEKPFVSSNLQPQQHLLAARAKGGQKAPPIALPVPPTGSSVADVLEVSSKNAAFSEKVSGSMMRDTQLQSNKPSGLRMPSPSLGFFSQPKSSGTSSLSQMATPSRHSAGSHVPSSLRLNDLNCINDSRQLNASEKLPVKIYDNTSNENIGVSDSSLECVSSSGNYDIHGSVKVKSEERNAMVTDAKFAGYGESFNEIKEIRAAQSTINVDKAAEESENSFIVEQKLYEQQIDLQMNEDKLPSLGQSIELLENDCNDVIVALLEPRGSTTSQPDNIKLPLNSCRMLDQTVHETSDAIQRQYVEDNQSSSPIVSNQTIFESLPENTPAVTLQDIEIMMYGDDSSAKPKHDLDQWKTEIEEQPDASCVEANNDIIMKGPRNDRVLLENKSCEPLIGEREDLPNCDANLCKSGGSELLDSNTSPEQANQESFGLDVRLDKLCGEHILSHALYENVDTKKHTAEVHVEYSKVDNDNCPLLFTSAAGKHCVVVQNTETPLYVNSELNHSGVISENQSANQDDVAVLSQNFELPQVDVSPSNAKEKKSLLKDCHSSFDSQFRPGKTGRDHQAGAVTTCNLSKEEDIEANDLEISTRNLSKEDVGISDLKNHLAAESKVFSDITYVEKEKMDDRMTSGDYYAGDPAKVIHESLGNFSSAGSSQTTCLLESTTGVDEFGTHSSNVLCTGDKEVQTFHESSSRPGFSDQEIQTSPKNFNAADTRIKTMNSLSPASIEPNISQKNEYFFTVSQHEQDNASCLTEDDSKTLLTKRSENGERIDNLAIKPPVDAIPFSDEWLAAMEAAGEEILTMKRGAVQNSPTDKTLPEPSPWSPVKRKQNEIGPFDCTKFTNIKPDSD